MESKFDNAPNETNSMKTKKKHFYSFSFFHVSERSEMWEAVNESADKAITTSKQWAIKNWNFRGDGYHWQTHNNYKICFLGSGGVVFLSGWKIPTSNKSVTISLFVGKKLPNFQEINLGVVCTSKFCHISTHFFFFSVLKQIFTSFLQFFCPLMLNLVYDVWDVLLVLHKKSVPKKNMNPWSTWQHFHFPFSKYLQMMILFLWVSVVGHALYAHQPRPINLHGCWRRKSNFLKQSLHFWLKTLLSKCCSPDVAPAPHIWKYIYYW